MLKIRHYSSALFALLLNFVLLLTVASGTVFAHAKVDGATPGIGATVSTAPTSISVHTAENMKPGAQFSNLFVYGPGGDLISQGDAKIPLSKPNEMSVAIKPEKDGVYVVRWITVSSDDGDPDQGAFTFTVKSSATGSTTGSSTQGASPAKAAPASNTSSFPTLPVIITGLIALLVGLSAGFGIGRNRAATSTLKTAGSSEAINSDRVAR